MNPQVSVLVPIWRPDHRYLRECIDSVVAQTVNDWELILIEDRSAVSVDELVRSYEDPRIKLHKRSGPSSLPAALNDGLRLCRASMVARLDADDICEPQRFEKQIPFLEQNPSVAVVGSSLTIVDDSGAVIGRRLYPTSSPDVASAMRRYNALAHPSVMFRRDDVLALGGYATGRAEDYDLWCRLMKSGRQLANLAEPLVRYRFHPQAMTRENVHDAIRATIALKKIHFSDSFTPVDRLRLAAESALLLLPPRLVLRLFRMTAYRRA